MFADIMQDTKCKQGEGVGRSSVAGHLMQPQEKNKIMRASGMSKYLFVEMFL